jgi:hypothetical protein
MMFVELELAQARLRRRGAIAEAVRRQTGLEWTGAGYRARARPRVARMQQQIARIPKGVDRICVLWSNNDGSCFVEFSDGDRLCYITVPWVAVKRFDRQAGRRRQA